MNRLTVLLLTVFTTFVGPLGGQGPLHADESVVGWRGDGSGHCLGADPPTQFSERDHPRWRADIGQGCGAAIVVGDRLLLPAAPHPGAPGPAPAWTVRLRWGKLRCGSTAKGSWPTGHLAEGVDESDNA